MTKNKKNRFIKVNEIEEFEIDGDIYTIKKKFDGEDYMTYSRNTLSEDSTEENIKEKNEGYTVTVGIVLCIVDLSFKTETGKNWLDESFEERIKTVQRFDPIKIYMPLAKKCMPLISEAFDEKKKKKLKTPSGSGEVGTRK